MRLTYHKEEWVPYGMRCLLVTRHFPHTMSLVSGAAPEGGLTCSVPQMKESVKSRNLLESSAAERRQGWCVSRPMCLPWERELCLLHEKPMQCHQGRSSRTLSGTLEAKHLSFIRTLLRNSKCSICLLFDHSFLLVKPN